MEHCIGRSLLSQRVKVHLVGVERLLIDAAIGVPGAVRQRVDRGAEMSPRDLQQYLS